MNSDKTLTLNRDKCSGCKLCIDICPDRTLSIVEEKATVTGEQCMQCGHCQAVCPENAITVAGIDANNLDFSSFDFTPKWIEWGNTDVADLVGLMASRRSCRKYQDKVVPREILNDLVKIAITAPSGTNSQKWTFTVLDNRDKVRIFGVRVADFFRKINRMAENPFLRTWSRLFSNNVLGNYHKKYYQTIKNGLREWDKNGKDLLFHHAPAAIVVATAPGASCPSEDALLATQNILLAAHAMGLGSCLIGYAVSAVRYDTDIKEVISIPKDETVHAVIALGYPDEKYRRLTGRLPITVRYPNIS